VKIPGERGESRSEANLFFACGRCRSFGKFARKQANPRCAWANPPANGVSFASCARAYSWAKYLDLVNNIIDLGASLNF
jgi:hypothetical protein